LPSPSPSPLPSGPGSSAAAPPSLTITGVQLTLVINSNMNSFISRVDGFRSAVATFAGVQSQRVTVYSFDTYDAAAAKSLLAAEGVEQGREDLLTAGSSSSSSSSNSSGGAGGGAARGLLGLRLEQELQGREEERRQGRRAAERPGSASPALAWLHDLAAWRSARRQLAAGAAQLLVTSRITASSMADAANIVTNIRNTTRQSSFRQEAAVGGCRRPLLPALLSHHPTLGMLPQPGWQQLAWRCTLRPRS
jgi:hypothetical protein